MRRDFAFFDCDRCGAEVQSRVLPEDWFKIDIYAKQFASMKERHFCSTCGPLLATVIEERPE